MSAQGVKETAELLIKNVNSNLPKEEYLKEALEDTQPEAKTLSDEVKELVLSTEGHINSTKIYSILHLSTRKDKKNVSMILKRLEDKELIEKTGLGDYRRKHIEIREINYKSAVVKRFPIELPFGLSDIVHIYPRNLIVLAGEINSGKTTMALNIAEMNEDKMPVDYLSSEFSDEELALRLGYFPKEQWKTRFIDRQGDYPDLIDGSFKLWIIDYLELVKNFFQIADIFNDIHGKLKKGVCVVCIQKDEGKKLGRGGDFGKEKPRLYLNLSPGKMKIKKAKNFDPSYDPNGKEAHYNIKCGAILHETKGFTNDLF